LKILSSAAPYSVETLIQTLLCYIGTFESTLLAIDGASDSLVLVAVSTCFDKFVSLPAYSGSAD
jgi:hypothetical protein